MEKIKRNRKEKYTLGVIRESFLQMLQKKPIEKITVGALCEKADINRSTFYRHYADIYDLLNTIANECYDELFENLSNSVDFSSSFEEGGYGMILRAFEITEENKELYSLLLFEQTSSRLMQRVADACFSLYQNAHTSSYLPAEESYLHYHYLVHGITGIWSAWIKDGCKIPKETVAKIVKEQMGGFFHTMNSWYWPPNHK